MFDIKFGYLYKEAKRPDLFYRPAELEELLSRPAELVEWRMAQG